MVPALPVPMAPRTPSLLVVFESRYGQSAKIAAHIVDRAERHGIAARATLVELGRYLIQGDDADAFAIVAPVYFGRHPAAVEDFARHYADRLSAKPTAFVSVSGSGGTPSAAARARSGRYAERFLERTRLRPAVVATTAGAIAYPRYNLFLRAFMWLLHRREAADLRRTHELTDWPALDAALERFLAGISSEEPAALDVTVDR